VRATVRATILRTAEGYERGATARDVFPSHGRVARRKQQERRRRSEGRQSVGSTDHESDPNDFTSSPGSNVTVAGPTSSVMVVPDP
jgi:hypothetical protein